MIANDVDDAKQVATLLSVMGASTYGLARNLVQPLKPKDKTFREIVSILQAHFEPKPLIIAERFRFQRCVQKPHETVSQYVADLKQCVSKFDFGVVWTNPYGIDLLAEFKVKHANGDCFRRKHSLLHEHLKLLLAWKPLIGTRNSCGKLMIPWQRFTR